MLQTDVAPTPAQVEKPPEVKYWVRDCLLPLRAKLAKELQRRYTVWDAAPKPFNAAPRYARLVGVKAMAETESIHIALANHGPHLKSTAMGKPYSKFVIRPKLVTYEAPPDMETRLAFFIDSPICQEAPVYVYRDGRIVIYNSYEMCGEAREANQWQILYWTEEQLAKHSHIRIP